MSKQGSVSCVGIGMTLGAHLTPLARSYIEQADVCFAAVSNGVVEQWLMDMHPDVRSLQRHYGDGRSRLQTYRDMTQEVLVEVRRGQTVCGLFYGHPGVFATVPHRIIRQAQKEGYPARMIPGISAEDCLIADLGMDPGAVGCLQMEATQLLLFRRRLDPTVLLILWQVGVVGDPTFAQRTTGPAQRRVLLERLLETYPADHRCVLYEAATLPLMASRVEELALGDLADAAMGQATTLVVPPAVGLERDGEMTARLGRLEQ